MTAAMQHETRPARSGKADGSRALIVTWNPDKGKWAKRPRGYHYAIEQTARGETVEEDWSTGNRIRGVSRGDRRFCCSRETRAGESSRAERSSAKSTKSRTGTRKTIRGN